jgi:lysophospholipase L1-like esterase
MTMTRTSLTAVLMLTLATVACDKGTSSVSPTSLSTVYYTAIGASDAIGYGSSVVCTPYATDCQNGMGYVQVITRQLQARGSTVTLTNLGLPAAVIGPDFLQLGLKYNRTIPGDFINSEVPFIPRNTTLVTIFAGGNDVNTVATALNGGAGGSDPWGYIDQQIKAFAADFATLLQGIRDRAPGARIVIANVPNFAAIPMTKNYTLEQKQVVQKISVGFSTQVVNPLVSQGIAVVDLLCDSRFASAAIFSSDGFHPNDTGYAIMAAEMMNAIISTSYPSPSASCSQMVAVPAK